MFNVSLGKLRDSLSKDEQRSAAKEANVLRKTNLAWHIVKWSQLQLSSKDVSIGTILRDLQEIYQKKKTG